jgi:anti-sigma B factor antagonist
MPVAFFNADRHAVCPYRRWMVEKKSQGVWIEGRVNIDTSGDMRRRIAEALRSTPPSVMLDLSGVSYIDTSGVATLLEASRIARRQGTRLVLHGLHGQPHELLHFSQIDHLLDIAEPEPDGPASARAAQQPSFGAAGRKDPRR